MEKLSQKEKVDSIHIRREFNAARTVLFNAFKDPKALSQWWGPEGFKMTVTKIDFKPGGICLFKMENPEAKMWARFIYQSINEPDLVEMILSFSNEDGELLPAPFFDHWPKEILNTLKFSEANGKTILEFTARPYNASQLELEEFSKNKSSFNEGLNSSLNRLSGMVG